MYLYDSLCIFMILYVSLCLLFHCKSKCLEDPMAKISLCGNQPSQCLLEGREQKGVQRIRD